MKDFWEKHWRKLLSMGLVLTFICTLPVWRNDGNDASIASTPAVERYYSYVVKGNLPSEDTPEYNWPEYQDYLKAGEVTREAANIMYSINPNPIINFTGTGSASNDPANQAARNYMLQYYPNLPVGKDCHTWTHDKFVARAESELNKLGYEIRNKNTNRGHHQGYLFEISTGKPYDWGYGTNTTTEEQLFSSESAGSTTSGQKSSKSSKSSSKQSGSSGAKTKKTNGNGQTSAKDKSSSSDGTASAEPEPTLTALSDDSKAKEMVIVKAGVPIWCNFYGKAGQYTGEDNNRILPIGQHVTITGVTSNGFYQLYAAGNPTNTTFRINVSKDTEGATPYYIDINGMDPNDPFIVPLSEYKGSWIFTGTYKAATCTKDGWKEEKNDLTGQTRHVKIPKIPHHTTDYVVVKKPGLFLSGKKEAVCIVCHKVVKTKKIPSKISSFFSGKK